MQSAIDRDEAVTVGKNSVLAALNGETDKMVGIFRDCDDGKYKARYKLVDLSNVMMTERKLPEKFVNKDRNGITPEFAKWLDPMLMKTDYFPIVNFN